MVAWQTPPSPLPPLPGNVHVWGARLDRPEPDLRRLERLLPDEERARANRFHRPGDRRRYVAAHGILRTLLGAYLGIEPTAIVLRAGAHGKPALDRAADAPIIHFNLSHAGDVAAYAFAAEREVGIDVEAPDRALRAADIAARYFPAGEAALLRSLPEDERATVFLRSWVCKEAFAKAVGLGLASLDVRALALVTAGGPRLEGLTDPARRLLADWDLFELPTLHGCPGALVAQGTGWLPRFWLYSDD